MPADALPCALVMTVRVPFSFSEFQLSCSGIILSCCMTVFCLRTSQTDCHSRSIFLHNNNNDDDNNNNNYRIHTVQVCRMTSEVLGRQLQSCYTARARPKCVTEEKCF